MYINDLCNISKVLELIFGGLSNSDDDSVKNFQNVRAYFINNKINAYSFALFAWALVLSVSLNDQFCWYLDDCSNLNFCCYIFATQITVKFHDRTHFVSRTISFSLTIKLLIIYT